MPPEETFADGGAGDRGNIDTVVLVEATVLTGEHSILQVLRDVLPRGLFAVLGVDRGDLDELAGVLRRLGEQRIALGLLVDADVLGQAVEDADGVAGGDSGDGEGRGDHDGHENPGECAQAHHAGESADDAGGFVILGRHRMKGTAV